MAGGVAGSFWRQAGVSYLQILAISTKALRGALKEPHRSRALGREVFFFNKHSNNEKIGVTSLFK